jgi:hypothetical protein
MQKLDATGRAVAASNLFGFGTCQKWSYTGTSAQSAALGASTTAVLITLTTAGFVLVGSNPTALTDGTNRYIPAATPTLIPVVGGQKIAAIKEANDGVAYVMEIDQ